MQIKKRANNKKIFNGNKRTYLQKINFVLLLIILTFTIINNLILINNILIRTQKNEINEHKIRNFYEESLIINDLANKNYLKNFEFQQNNTRFYDLFVVLQNNNKTKAYSIGRIAKEYLYFGNVVNEVVDSKNIVFMLCPTFNVLSVYERKDLKFNPSYIRYSCSKNAEWTMFMDEKGDLYDVLFGIYRGNYFSSQRNLSIEKLNPIHYKVMNKIGVLSLENAEIYE